MNWKKFSLWSGLGGLLFGTAVYALKKSATKVPLYAESIPKGVRRLRIELEPRGEEMTEGRMFTQGVYVCEPTAFYLWTVLPGRQRNTAPVRSSTVSETKGTQIFYVVPLLRRWTDEPSGEVVTESNGEPFYATVHVHAETVRRPLVSQIARDYPMKFRKCLVGGSVNGIDTGEVVISTEPVVEYQFEMGDR